MSKSLIFDFEIHVDFKNRSLIMKARDYKTGKECEAGQRIALILGKGEKVVVYTTESNELRWHYDGKIPSKLRPSIGRFDANISAIKAMGWSLRKKQSAYHLLGKCLFQALDEGDPKMFEDCFKPFELFLTKDSNHITTSRKVFIVHGHDGEAKESVARFLEHLKLDPVILHEQAERGQTIIEKFQAHSDVAFAVVLLTPDDIGNSVKKVNDLKHRARQNVIFELGFFVGKLGRNRVHALIKGAIEIPSDYLGILHTSMDSEGGWKMALVKELKSAGLRFSTSRAHLA